MSAQKFRKKPVEIEAWQWADHSQSEEGSARWSCELEAMAIVEWMDELWATDSGAPSYDPDLSGGTGPNGEDWGCFEIDTLEGTMEVSPYDYVIRGVHGEFYPCKPDIFAATYESVVP